MDFSRLSPMSWYPGHMRKAERELQDRLKLIDLVLEIVDARAPRSSLNPRLSRMAANKAHVIVINKEDLADSDTTKAWVRHFRDENRQCLALHHRRRGTRSRILKILQRAATDDRQRRGVTRPQLHATRIMVVGIPNVGKSSLINLLTGRKQAKIGPHPGVTRQQQWVTLSDDLELLDTPGVTLPKLKQAETGLRLGLLATIKDSVIGTELLVEYLHHVYRQQDRWEIVSRHKLDGFPATSEELLEEVGRRAGYINAGGIVRHKQAADLLLREFREGNYGRISLEAPG